MVIDVIRQPASFDDDACYRALTARDARFDGRLFVGVTSTGIYCRPVCRVRTPMRRNCRFFGTPAQAEAASFRPCLKCRPEIAPGAPLAWTVMDASTTLARQAATTLDDQAGSGHAASLVALADALGVSDRHLRRIFLAEHGVTPLQYLQTRRLLLAKQLLTDTRLPVAQVAFASGFASLRRFNAAFVDNYRMSPSRLRGAADVEGDRAIGAASIGPSPGTVVGHAPSVTLAYRAPYDVEAMLRFISLRAIPGIETVDGRCIRRSLRAGALQAINAMTAITANPAATAVSAVTAVTTESGWLEAEFLVGKPLLRLRFAPQLAGASGRVVAAVRRWLDLDAMPETIDAGLADLPGAPGLRLPGSVDSFELAVRAVLGQQVTVAAARTLARRLVARFGHAATTPWPGIDAHFPLPTTMAAASIDAIAELGIIRSRAATIAALGQAWPDIAPLLGPGRRSEPLIERLGALPGIGPWTAHYIAMRTLGWPDAFPPNDVAVLKAMKQLFGTANQREAQRQARAWQPWRAYAVLRLWNTLTPTKELAE